MEFGWGLVCKAAHSPWKLGLVEFGLILGVAMPESSCGGLANLDLTKGSSNVRQVGSKKDEKGERRQML